jgi:hypothetical protein
VVESFRAGGRCRNDETHVCGGIFNKGSLNVRDGSRLQMLALV